MTHPSELDLSLFAGGELGLLESWRVRRHVRGCSSCRNLAEQFRSNADHLRASMDQMPPDVDWDRLAAEMTGNIRVGLAAGECVAEVGTRQRAQGWRAAAVVCSATLLLVAAWMLNIPSSAPRDLSAIALEKTPVGIELKQGQGALTILHTRAVPLSPVISSSSPGQLRARYVDDETNQITITNVYAQ